MAVQVPLGHRQVFSSFIECPYETLSLAPAVSLLIVFMYYSKTQERFSSEDKKSAVRQVVLILKSVGKKYKEMIKQQKSPSRHKSARIGGHISQLFSSSQSSQEAEVALGVLCRLPRYIPHPHPRPHPFPKSPVHFFFHFFDFLKKLLPTLPSHCPKLWSPSNIQKCKETTMELELHKFLVLHNRRDQQTLGWHVRGWGSVGGHVLGARPFTLHGGGEGWRRLVRRCIRVLILQACVLAHQVLV